MTLKPCIVLYYIPFPIRWSLMPYMPQTMKCASALHINCDRDAIIIIGGQRGILFAPAALLERVFLLVRPRNSEPWQWRALSPMCDGRGSPGMLQMGPPGESPRIQRVLVAGGWRDTAEILKVDCTDASDRGQWTRIGRLSRTLKATTLIALNDRVLVFGELMCIGVTFLMKPILQALMEKLKSSKPVSVVMFR